MLLCYEIRSLMLKASGCLKTIFNYGFILDFTSAITVATTMTTKTTTTATPKISTAATPPHSTVIHLTLTPGTVQNSGISFYLILK